MNGLRSWRDNVAKLSLQDAIAGADMALRIAKDSGRAELEAKAVKALDGFLDAILEASGGK